MNIQISLIHGVCLFFHFGRFKRLFYFNDVFWLIKWVPQKKNTYRKLKCVYFKLYHVACDFFVTKMIDSDNIGHQLLIINDLEKRSYLNENKSNGFILKALVF